MDRSIELSSKADIVNFIILKRKFRFYFNRLLKVVLFCCFISVIVLFFYNRDNIIKTYHNIKYVANDLNNKMFETKINRVSIKLDDHSILDEIEINQIIKQLSGNSTNGQKLQQIISTLKEQNSLIENVYIRKVLANGNLDVFIKEKKIIAMLLKDNCIEEVCEKKLITQDNKVIKYHRINNKSNIAKIYGNINNVELSVVIKYLKQNYLFDKISYIHFYESGRFDLILKNKLLLKLSRNNWKSEIKKFNKLDSEYLLSSNINNIEYIDLRFPDKLSVKTK